MRIRKFETEEFFAKYEFSAPHLISVSDCESVGIEELIRLGGGCIEEFLQVKLAYPEMAGSLLLRSEIASLYDKIDADQILVLGSPIEGIYLTLNALVEKGDHVIVLSPAYDAFFNVAEHVTENVSRWYLLNDGKTWSLDFDALEKLITPSTKLIVINFPHNPSGFLPSSAELNRIVEIANHYGVRIFADEIYKGLEYDPQLRLPSMADLSEPAIVLGGASKSMGLPGLRLGWLVVKDPATYKKLYDFKSYTSMCATQAGEYLGRMAVRAAPQLLEKNLQIIKQNLLIAEIFFAKWQEYFEWLRPMAGSVSVIKLHAGSAEAYCHDLVQRCGVVLLPAKFMGYGDEYARIGFGRKSFQTGMDVFDKVLTSMTNTVVGGPKEQPFLVI